MVTIKGTGLGLFIVRSIARQHGGDVTATSAGLGLRNHYDLPPPARQPASRPLMSRKSHPFEIPPHNKRPALLEGTRKFSRAILS